MLDACGTTAINACESNIKLSALMATSVHLCPWITGTLEPVISLHANNLALHIQLKLTTLTACYCKGRMFLSQNLSIALTDNIEINKTVKLITC